MTTVSAICGYASTGGPRAEWEAAGALREAATDGGQVGDRQVQLSVGIDTASSAGGGRLQATTQAMHLKRTTTRSEESAGADGSTVWQISAAVRRSSGPVPVAGETAVAAICSSSAKATIQLVASRATVAICAAQGRSDNGDAVPCVRTPQPSPRIRWRRTVLKIFPRPIRSRVTTRPRMAQPATGAAREPWTK